jgi:hypothetical protein
MSLMLTLPLDELRAIVRLREDGFADLLDTSLISISLDELHAYAYEGGRGITSCARGLRRLS